MDHQPDDQPTSSQRGDAWRVALGGLIAAAAVLGLGAWLGWPVA